MKRRSNVFIGVPGGAAHSEPASCRPPGVASPQTDYFPEFRIMQKKMLQLVTILALHCASALGQTVSSSILGTLTDPTDAVVPGLQVELRNQATGANRSTSSTSVGLFRFLDLAPC